MKKYKFALIAITFLVSITTSFAQSALETGVKLKAPCSISDEANKGAYSNSSALSDNPFVNSYVNGIGNMIRGVSSNAYTVHEMQKQQMDYSKPQVENIND